MTEPLFGIDLGGTKTEGVVLLPEGKEVLRYRVPTIRDDYPATLTTIADLVASLEKETGATCTRLGVGIPGSVSPQTGLVRNANSTWINGRDLTLDLMGMLNREVRISNDANCLALSETKDGVAKGKSPVFAAILGTGIGGGLVVEGRIIKGAHALGGEWGHVALAHEDPNAPPCFCGRNGCNETYLSGPALVRDYIRSGGEPAPDVKSIIALAEKGHELAREALARHLSRLAQALAGIVNVIDPEMIVLGGGLSNLPGLVEDLKGALTPHIFAAPADKVEINIARARWGDSSGVRGAAWLWEGKT